LWWDIAENGWENSPSSSGEGERATGTVKALTERAPTTREIIRVVLKNMVVGMSWRRADKNGTRPEVWEVRE